MRFDGTGWITSTPNDRLADGYINPIVADSQGGAWIGTSLGLWHFDGVSWQGYMVEGLLGNVNDMAAAADGRVWFGADKGASSFDGRTWQTYTTTTALADKFIWQVSAASDGPVWFNSNGELASFDGTNWTHYHQVNFNASSLTASSGGVIWLAKRNESTVYRFDGRKLMSYTPGFRWVYDIATGPEGDTWFGTDSGLYRFDGENWVSYLDDRFGTSVTSITIASDGTLWCGGYGNYGYLAHFDGTTWTIYKLPGYFIDSVTVSPKGDVWAILDTPGETHGGTTTTKTLAIRFAHGEWTSYELEEVGVYGTQIVAASNGSVWILGYDGVLQIEGQ